MAEVRWSPKAVLELEDICVTIAGDSESAAQRFAERVVRATRQLTDFPRSGRMVPEFGRDDVRELIVQRYRVVYRLVEYAAEITTVRHGARLLDISDIGG